MVLICSQCAGMGTGRGECGLGKRKRGDVDEEDVDKGNEGGRKGVKKQRGRETNGGREVHAHVQVGEREGRREGGGGWRGRREGVGGRREGVGGREERIGRSNTLLTIEEGCSGLRVGGYTLQQCKGIAHSV